MKIRFGIHECYILRIEYTLKKKTKFGGKKKIVVSKYNTTEYDEVKVEYPV